MFGLCVICIIALNTDMNNYEDRVGDIVIIESDTLRVVGSQYFGEKYYLSNGLKVDATYLKTLEIVK